MPIFDATWSYIGKLIEVIHTQAGNVGSAIGEALIAIGKSISGMV